jgi:hypothetical protein
MGLSPITLEFLVTPLFPDIRKKTGCSELNVRKFGRTKLNKKLEKQGVRNEICPEDRNEHRQLLF